MKEIISINAKNVPSDKWLKIFELVDKYQTESCYKSLNEIFLFYNHWLTDENLSVECGKCERKILTDLKELKTIYGN